MVIHVDDLRKNFGRIRALDGVSLTVERGEIFGLLGRNGAGKTTLVKILLAIVFPSAGTGRVLGEPLGSPTALGRMGYLPEDHQLPEYHTAASALDFYGALHGLPRATRRRRSAALLERLELAPWTRTKIRKFSKGMRQRLGVAQALLHRPEVLILDEPTDGVDPVGRRVIRDLLRELKAEGVTIFLNSHLLSEIELVCDRVVIMDAGRARRAGTVDSLTAPGATYSFVVRGDPDPVLPALAKTGLAVERTRDGLRIQVADESAVDRVVDLLRAHGLGIRELRADRHSLEDVFLEVVEEGETGGRLGLDGEA